MLQPSPRTAIAAKRLTAGGRSFFTDTVRRVIIASIRNGNYPSEAANKAGIHYETLRSWLKRGYDAQALRLEGVRIDAQERAFANFYVEFYKAESDHADRLVEKIEAIGFEDGQWAALMTILERRYPDRWKKREQTEVVGVGGERLQVQVDNSPNALMEVVKALHASGALGGLLETLAGNVSASRAVIDAEAHEVHHEPTPEGPE